MTPYLAFEFPYPESAVSDPTPAVWTSFFPMVLLVSLLIVLVIFPIIRYRRKTVRATRDAPANIVMRARASDIEDEMDARATALQMDRTAYRARSARKVSIYDDRFGS